VYSKVTTIAEQCGITQINDKFKQH